MKPGNKSRDQAEQYPETNATDGALSALKVGLAGVPIIGGPAAELLGLVTTTIAERRDAWFRDQIAKVWEEVHTLRDDISPEKLAKDPQFVTAVVRTTQIAIGTHRTEKVKMLRSALRHVALGKAPSRHNLCRTTSSAPFGWRSPVLPAQILLSNCYLTSTHDGF
ncbi:MAG: hypothetical protein ACRD04_03495 [Terriglobales bacterium]